MYKKVNFVFVLSLVILLTSCVIEINENGYRSLPTASKKYIRPFSMDLLKQTHSYKDTIFIYEISSSDIKQITKSNKFTWIHFWAPYCSSKSCVNIAGLMNEVKEQQKEKDFLELLIATSFDFNAIKERLKNSSYTQPVFILSDSIYGHKQGKAMKLFASKIDNNSVLKKNEYFSEYLFCDTLLTVAAWNLTPQQIDSVLNKKILQWSSN